MTQAWLPNNYEVPKATGNYMKLDEEMNKFRILSQPIMGYEYWNDDNKPVRSANPFKGIPEDARLDEGRFKPKHFWAFVVWSYKEAKVQVLEITQATIQRAISDLVTNEDWGDPREYDITVTGKGEGLERKYTVQPSPHKAVPTDAHKAYREARVNLQALFDGADPFNTNSGSEGAETKPEVSPDDIPF